MPGTILPLPVMLEEEDRKAYEKLETPKSLVVRYGYQRLVAELPYDGDAKPGCGSKLVIRTNRGMELGEMLTSTCPNAGCSKSVTRKEMLQYIENSGGKDYPFTSKGKVIRVATIDDLNEQSRLDARKPEIIRKTKPLIQELDLPMRLVDVELLLGGERIIFFYTAEEWVDFRELVKQLASEYQTRIEMHQVNAREEARLVADYEKCGQHCCCKQFLKVLKPVSMRSAKVQKATLDPMKISGRCGRLMCCLRYEDQTYDDLRKRLPHRKSLVETDDGIGIVLDTQILTQLALVKIGREKPAAYPVENLRVLTKDEAAAWRAEFGDPSQVLQEGGAPTSAPAGRGASSDRNGDRRRPRPGAPLKDEEVESREGTNAAAVDNGDRAEGSDTSKADDQPRQSGGYRGKSTKAEGSADQNAEDNTKRRRRRRGRGRGGRNRRPRGGTNREGGGGNDGGGGGDKP